MALSDFDKYFLHLPPLYREKDFDSFWDKAIAEIKKIPIEPLLKKDQKKSTNAFTVYDTHFTGFTKTKISGTIFVPNRNKKPNAIVYIHDYNNLRRFDQNVLDESMAYFFLTLRGHDVLDQIQGEDVKSPGFIIENILDRDTYYAKAVYLDVFRSIDMLRLISDVNCSSIGIIGTGFGAAAAIFTAIRTNRVTALVLDAPSFCYFPLSQNISTSDATNEINEFLAGSKGKKKDIKKNLSYFDALNFSDRITCPVLVITGFKDTISPPECVFALFNHIMTEKVMEVYPDEGYGAGGENQFKKSIQWLVGKISALA